MDGVLPHNLNFWNCNLGHRLMKDPKTLWVNCLDQNILWPEKMKGQTFFKCFLSWCKFKNCNWHHKGFYHIVRKEKKTSWISMRYETNLLLLIIYPTVCDLRSKLQIPFPCSRHITSCWVLTQAFFFLFL